MLRNFFLLFLVIFLLQACGGHPMFEQNLPVEGAKWLRGTQKTFKVRIAKANVSSQVYILVRNTGAYPYSNLWLFVSVRSPGGQVEKDTVEIQLATPSGRWTGKRAAGLYENKFLWRNPPVFSDTGVYIFHYRQAMRDDELNGIQDVGICVSQGDESSN